MKRYIKFFSCLGVLIAVSCGLIGWSWFRPKKAPNFTLSRLDGSQPITLSAANHANPILLIFWASWCPSCVEEIPAVNAIQKKYASKGLRVFAVNVQESKETLTAFLRTHRIDYPVLLDSTGDTASKYKIEGLPVSVLLAKDGEILYYGFSLPGNLDELLETRRVS